MLREHRLIGCIICEKKIGCYDDKQNPIWCKNCQWINDCSRKVIEKIYPIDYANVCDECSPENSDILEYTLTVDRKGGNC